MVGGGDSFYLKFWVNRPYWSEHASDDQRLVSLDDIVCAAKLF